MESGTEKPYSSGASNALESVQDDFINIFTYSNEACEYLKAIHQHLENSEDLTLEQYNAVQMQKKSIVTHLQGCVENVDEASRNVKKLCLSLGVQLPVVPKRKRGLGNPYMVY